MAEKRGWNTVLLIWATVFWFLVLLSTQSNVNDRRYLGCYQDDGEDRLFDGGQLEKNDQLTIDICIKNCINSTYAGAQNSQECWCGNENYTKHGDCEAEGIDCSCDSTCAGNNTEMCGGHYTMSIYKTECREVGKWAEECNMPCHCKDGVPCPMLTGHCPNEECEPGWEGESCSQVVVEDTRYLGCYQDDNPERIFEEQRLIEQKDLTIDMCVKACYNYTYAGAQYGEECFCGLEDEDYTVHGQCGSGAQCSCNRPCGGNSSEWCGNVLTMSVYKTECREVGKWAENCDQSCHCRDGMPCRMLNGRCPNNECAPGWEELSCNKECDDGKYGLDCAETCNCDDDKDCIKHNGTCSSGICKPGFDFEKDPACHEACQQGKFGENCAGECNCNDNIYCINTNGTCSDGSCPAGFDYDKDETCHSECDAGTFGLSCTSTCNCFSSDTCDNVQGSCVDDLCAPGFNNSELGCQESCQQGQFGVNCIGECKCLDDDSCLKTNGTCLNGICRPGYDYDRDETCQIACQQGQFGTNCIGECKCLDDDYCLKTNGTCSNGICRPGYDYDRDETCQLECDDGTFGLSCAMGCNCLDADICNKEDGVCANGQCAHGYTNDDTSCQTECTSGKYGLNCIGSCNCNDEIECVKANGTCPNGLCQPGFDYSQDPACQEACEEGKYGLRCTSSCGCEPEYCDKASGECTSGSADITFIIVGVIGGLLVAILIVGGFLYKRRMGNRAVGSNAPATNQSSTTGSTSSEMEELHSSKSNLIIRNDAQIYENVNQIIIPPTTAIRLGDLQSIVLPQKKRGMPFNEEYDSLPQHSTEDQTGSITGNRSKNRYKNIIPYDNARVKLNMIGGDPLTDYINASYMDGYKKERKFIAAQAPMERTLPDFWRMMWEQKVEFIVMLTELIEGAKLKCHKYWADNGKTLTAGSIQIRTLGVEEYPHHIMRKLELTNGDEVRQVKQLHCTAWRDFNVPDNSNVLLQFHQNVQEKVDESTNDGPILVHCSAGVGRTGTFIALDYLLEQAKKEGLVDIYSCLEKMRARRPYMINTRIQYEYLYETMLEWYRVGMTSAETADFQKLYFDRKKIQQQFQFLEECRQNIVVEPEEPPGLLGENVSKNRNPKIVPFYESQLRLMTSADSLGDYINAAFVDGHKEKNSFVATQLPLPNTSGDFWRMVWDYQLCVIVSFLDKDGEVFWPEPAQKIGEGLFSMETKSIHSISGRLTAYDVTLTHLATGKSQELKLFKCVGFNGSKETIEELLAICDIAPRWQRSLECKTTLVQCLYGVKQCGIYIALANLLTMMSKEREVDIFQCVKQIRKHRPEFIENLEEYQFLYDVINQYVESNTNLYQNLV